MKKKIGLLLLIISLSLIVMALIKSQNSIENNPAADNATQSLASHEAHALRPARVPAFQSVTAAANLGQTLAPEQFIGKTREAYKVAKKIPTTLAQLPCYCECDRGLGHKSLHSCFEDEHASHCVVCVDEALLAYQLQTQAKMTPEQVRQRIIEKYSEVD